MTSDPLIDEERWQETLGRQLGQMPVVEPPSGFIEDAIDHRPLFAGRIMVGLLAATVAVLAIVVGTGVVERAGVVPPIDDLVLRHDLAARAGLSTDGDPGSAAPSGQRAAESQLSLPDGFEPEGTVAAEDLRQAVYARGDESVSVFVQDGRVDWSGLPGGGLTELDGLAAWVDGERRIAVVETAGGTVTVVGLAPEELERTVRSAPRVSTGFWDRVEELAEAVVETFGYAPAG